ncbi:P-loop containing nucleoside triphosphate hydrolase protein [Gigaspora rosea]|uniref:P-loop containing nucleoside triphosphate hydrolase protein n=1 Tax=Gigaspora rosea TaxID=44941 RepID=A0A397U7X9_9GLOM|nr:P-loop containing nucleoside triphosphate hydrolase protein [Gigaspora rosea]
MMAGNVLKARTIAVLGSREVGKSSLITQFVGNRFVESYQPSVETTFRKVIRYKGHEVEAEIIDTAGQVEHSILSFTHVVGIHGYILVYSVTSKQSFEMVKIIRNKILNYSGRESVPIVLVGNKMDLHHQRQLTFEEGKNLASHWQCAWTEASAKNNDNIIRIFKLMINEMEKDINPNSKELSRKFLNILRSKTFSKLETIASYILTSIVIYCLKYLESRIR